MKIIVLKEKLVGALQNVGSIAGSNKTLAVLSNVKLTASNNKLTIEATNLESAMVVTIGCKVEDGGSTTLPAKLLFDYVSAIPIDRIEMSLEGTTTTVRAGGYSSTMNGLPSGEFPELPTVEKSNPIIVETKAMKDVLNKTQLSISTDNTRPVLGGLYVDSDQGKIVWVSTDSYRMSIYNSEIKSSHEPFVVPRATIGSLSRVLSKAEDKDKVRIFPGEGQVGIEVGDTSIISRLIEGSYPNYAQLVPSEATDKFLADRKELVSVVKVAGLFSREAAGSVMLSTSEAGQEARVDSNANQVGKNSSAVKAEVKGDISIALNSRYLLEGLNVFASDIIEVWGTGKISPLVLRSPGDDDYIHMIMPLRT